MAKNIINWIKNVLLILIFILIVTITACSGREPIQTIMGKWVSEDTTNLWEFAMDGTFILREGEEIVISGEYEIIDESHIRLIHESLNPAQGVLAVVVTKDKLKLTALYLEEGAQGTYTRVR